MPQKGGNMLLLAKVVKWSSVVELGMKLSDHGSRKGFREAFQVGQRCPINSEGFGPRCATINGEVAAPSPWEWIEAVKALDLAKGRLENVEADLHGFSTYYEYDEYDKFLHTLCAYAEDDVDYLEWESATSRARIVCIRENGQWKAEFHEGNKPSRYAQLWAEMRA
jgi:hypothetical protein